MTTPTEVDLCINRARWLTKTIIGDLERHLGIDAGLPITLALAGALDKLDAECKARKGVV